jgi:hypothetical protein
VPQRRRTALALTLAAALALTAGCEFDVEVAPGSVPAPFSVAPVPAASAGRPGYVCTAVYKILTDGALRLAEYATGSGDDARTGMRKTFADMATRVAAAGAGSSDPAQREVVAAFAADLTEGSRAADPRTFLDEEFATIGQKLDGTCG